ncbi:MAG TPA: hypothetical protein VIO58_11320 [Candidatus Methanoperedens sp.]
MRRLYLIMVGLLVLLVLTAGCVNKQTSEQPQQKAPSGSSLEGNITVPGEQDFLIEDAQTSQDENVDMGSLI